jgi:integrase
LATVTRPPRRPRGRRGNNEGSIYFDATRQKWVGAVTLASGKRKVFRDEDRDRVRVALAEAVVNQARGLPSVDERQTLAQYLAEWIDGADVDRERRPSTLYGYRHNIEKHVNPHIGRVPLGRLKPLDVQRLMRHLRAEGLAEKTVSYVRATLRVALADALELELITRNPAVVARRRGRKRGQQERRSTKVTPLSEPEALRFLAVCRGERLEVLFVLAVCLGLRRGELLGLRWQDIDWARRQLHVRYQLQRDIGVAGLHLVEVKTDGSARTLDLPDMLVDDLRAHHERQTFEKHRAEELGIWRNEDLVFCGELGGGIETTTLFRIYQRCRESAGVTARFHDLRHTAASLMLAHGVELWQVSKILGHASYQFTLDTYGHLYQQPRRDAADRVNAMLSRGRATFATKLLPAGIPVQFSAEHPFGFQVQTAGAEGQSRTADTAIFSSKNEGLQGVERGRIEIEGAWSGE